MSLPPRITMVGTQTVHDTTSKVQINAQQGFLTTITITATDPESDPITCEAFLLQDGMSFNPTTCTMSWTPSAPVGTRFYVKFRVSTSSWPKASGGTDAIIVEFTVTQPGLLRAEGAETTMEAVPKGSNPTKSRLVFATPVVGGSSTILSVFDLSGRRVALVRAPSGSMLVWEGKDQSGAPVRPGIYLYRMEVGNHRQEGKVIVFR